MTLKEHIDDIRSGLQKGIYIGEAAVSQSIVLRLLGALDWPTYNPQVVTPEYGVEGTRVDFALCHPPSKPRVFIEAKQVGNIKGAEEQLFGYDSRVRVPIAVLTDGREWQFFHPTGEGTWAERKVCELDLIAGESAKNAEKLNRYLNYESIRTGGAVETIKADYEEVVQQRQVATRLPEAWNKLVEEADEFLLHAVAEKTESLCGYKPTNEQVINFLKNLQSKIELDREMPSSLLVQQNSVRPIRTVENTSHRHYQQQKTREPAKLIVVTMPNGEVIKEYSGIGTFVKVIEKLIGEYGEEVVLRAADGHPIISTSSFNYPGKRDKRLGQLYISTNHGTEVKKTYLDYIANRLRVNMSVDIVDKS